MEATSNALVGPPFPDVLEEELGEEIILFHAKHRRFVTLNETAADIWRLCTGDFTLEGIVQRIAGFYDTNATDVRAEVEAAIAELIDGELLPPVDSR